MGVIHKLKPEIIEFILEQKKQDKNLSCRSLTGLIEGKFNVQVSKSSINAIIKDAGLSLPIGRRNKNKGPGEAKASLISKVIQESADSLSTVWKVPQETLLSGPVQEEAQKLEQLPEPEIKLPEPEVKPQEPEIKPPEPEVKPPQPAAKPQEVKPVEPVIEPIAESPIKEAPVFIPLEDWKDKESSGAILLKAADYLLGGSFYLSEAASKRLNQYQEDVQPKIEALIFAQLFEDKLAAPESLSALQVLAGRKFSLEDLNNFAKALEENRLFLSETPRILTKVSQEVRCLKFSLSDGNSYYLDAQDYCIWSSPHISTDFSASLREVKNSINKSFFSDSAFVIFNAPGYDIPSAEFFNFMFSLGGGTKKISRITLLNHRLEEVEVIPYPDAHKHNFVFGLWPWQYSGCRQVKRIGEFKPFHLDAQNKDLFIADLELNLTHAETNQQISLKGVALKLSLEEKIKLAILTNIENSSCENLVNIYLNRWPNLSEAFQDFSRKVELFTYASGRNESFSEAAKALNNQEAPSLKALINNYLAILDLYLRWYFLPQGYAQKSFEEAKKAFYSLKVGLNRQNKAIKASFKLIEPNPASKDLDYLLRRLNEREVLFGAGQERLWFLT